MVKETCNKTSVHSYSGIASIERTFRYVSLGLRTHQLMAESSAFSWYYSSSLLFYFLLCELNPYGVGGAEAF